MFKIAGFTIKKVIPTFNQSKDLRFVTAEKCPSLSSLYRNTSKETDVLWAMFFRKPETLIISQFMECKYAPWGIHTTAMTDFPRDLPDLEGLEKWIDHMVQMGKTAPPNVPVKTIDYNCYNPNDMQTRYLVCASMPKMQYGPHHLPPRELPFALALNVLERLPFVGIMEYLRESLCLLASMIGPLPEFCPCERKDEALLPHITHSVPRYNISFPLLSRVSQSQVLAITGMDRLLYHAAYQRFRRDLTATEKRLGVNITCSPLPPDAVLSGENFQDNQQ